MILHTFGVWAVILRLQTDGGAFVHKKVLQRSSNHDTCDKVGVGV